VSANLEWFKVFGVGGEQLEAISGAIPARSTNDFLLKLNSAHLRLGEYIGMLEFTHNAMSGVDTVKIDLSLLAQASHLNP